MPESRRRRVSEGRARRTREFAGNRKRSAQTNEIPSLPFGEHGELTPKTIEAANLTKAEEKVAYEMLKVQAAYVQILECLTYVVDPEGHVHDLSALGPTKLAIAYTLALNGFRPSAKAYIKKRDVSGSAYPDAHTWVDARSPDEAAYELRPEHKANDTTLPPDTRRLAAIRDGAPGQELPQWAVKPEVKYIPETRKERRLP